MPGIAIIIVTWNSEACIGPCLASLYARHGGDDMSVIVVDNGSRDATIDTVRKHYPQVTAVALNANTGFPKACNFGASLTDREYVLFLNPDACIKNDVLAILSASLAARPDAGAAGPQVFDHDGTPAAFAARQFPKLSYHLLRQFGLRALSPRSGVTGGETFGDKALTGTTVVPCLTGAAICMTRELFESVGGFPDDLPMYYDDMGLCAAVQRAGKACYYVPEAQVEHLGGESSSLSPARLQLHQMENGQAPWLFFRNERSVFHAAAFTLLIGSASLFRLGLVFVLLPLAALQAPLRPRFQRIFRESLFLLIWSLSRKKTFARRFDPWFDPMPDPAALEGIRESVRSGGAPA